MTLNLYFLRHGETEFSQTGGFCGFINANLTDAGREMAQEFAAAHKDLKWAAIFCSSLKRAADTAAPLAELVGLELNLRDGLREINYGKWEGLTHDIVKKQFAEDYTKWIAEPGWNAPTGGETAFQIAERSMNVVSEIMLRHLDGNILIVSHKATIRITLCALLGIEIGRYRDRINCLTGAVSVLKMGDHGPLLEGLNDRSYLSPALRQRQGT